MQPRKPPICLKCAHYHRDDDDRFACDAFPDSIPPEIIFSTHDHHDPYPGDHGIQFEARED